MAKIKNFIPFSWLPASWGLRGSTRKIAEAEYSYDGEDLEYHLIQIHHGDNPTVLKEKLLTHDLRWGRITPHDFDTQTLGMSPQKNDPFETIKIDHKHGLISDHDFDVFMADRLEGNEKLLELLNIQLKYGEINQLVFDKESATVKGEPYIIVVNDNLDLSKGLENTYFEFDWNTHFIELLRAYGFNGKTEEDVVEKWFQAWCQQAVFNSLSEEVDPHTGGPGFRYTH